MYGDQRLADAARIVLDLSAAKFAATSNRGRRIVPFRRLSDGDGDEASYLYQSTSGADHEIARAMLLSGQTQLLDIKRSVDDMIGTLAEMVNAATSNYSLPPPVAATAVERRVFQPTVERPVFQQTMRLGTVEGREVERKVERVFQSPAFTISAGGVKAPPAITILGVGLPKDYGVAMPTVIIPTIAGAYMRDLFRFDGIGIHHKRTNNTCVGPGFACGISPQLSAVFASCTSPKTETPLKAGIYFVSSAECLNNADGPHFYLAARIADCPKSFCGDSQHTWGVMEIREATPDLAFDSFKVERTAALNAVTLDQTSIGTYVTAAGHRIVFQLGSSTPGSSGFSIDTVIRTIDGEGPPLGTNGEAIFADGKGCATLKGPGGPVNLDFSNWMEPKRAPCR